MSEINGVTLQAMSEELVALNHEHQLAKEALFGALGSKVLSGAGKAVSSLVSRGGRVGRAAGKAQSVLGKGVSKGVNRFGGKAGLHKAVGAATVGAGAVGAGAVGAGLGRATAPTNRR
ncbi:MAG: hypothetical protein DRQ64_00140 [Gammaproteobacteria bacterium]|nr:MAG: hypothetical protein DRQ64_00140 [Gammaproteobacteria bacterium]